jgi:hypothetical protein
MRQKTAKKPYFLRLLMKNYVVGLKNEGVSNGVYRVFVLWLVVGISFSIICARIVFGQ